MQQNVDQNTKNQDPSSPSNEALSISYENFIDAGYTGSHSDFFQLMCTNEEALNAALEDAQDQGYTGDVNSFKSLIGVSQAQNNVLEQEDQEAEELKKKATPLELEDGESESIDIQTLPEPTGFNYSKYKDEYDKKQYEAAVSKLRELTPDLDIPENAEEFYKKKGETPPELNELSKTEFADKGISAKELERRKASALEAQKKLGDDDFNKSLQNTLTNSIGQLALTDDWMKYNLGVLLRSTGDNFDIEPLEDLGIKFTADSSAEIDRVESYRRAVANFTDEGGIHMKVAAFIDGVSGVAVSAAQSQATFGVGLASNIMGQSIKTYNRERAASKGISVNELYDQGDFEITTPAIIGGVSFAFERAGLGKLAKSFNLANATGKQKLVHFLQAIPVEGGTEGLQFINEKINEYLGANEGSVDNLKRHLMSGPAGIGTIGITDPKFTNYISKIPSDPMFWESIFKGMAGGGFASGSGVVMSRYMKTPEQIKVQEMAAEGLRQTADMRAKRNLSEEESAAVDVAEEGYKRDINDVQKDAEQRSSNLGQEKSSRVAELHTEMESLNNQMINVSTSENMNDQMKQVVIDKLKEKFNKAQQEIDSIREESLKTPEQEASNEEEVKVEEETDKKGRVYTRYSETSEKDGIKFTKFTFNRSDKDPSQRSSGGVKPETALGNKYEFDPESIPEGVTVNRVLEVREGKSGSAATVEFITPDGNRFRGGAILYPKQKAKRTDQKVESEPVSQDVEIDSFTDPVTFVTTEKSTAKFSEDGKYLGIFDAKTGEKRTSRRTIVDSEMKLVEQKDYTTGESAFDITGATTADPNVVISEYSNNPQEIAAAYIQETSKSDEDKAMNTLHAKMAEDGITIDPQGIKDALGFKNLRKEDKDGNIGGWLGPVVLKPKQEYLGKNEQGEPMYRVTPASKSQTLDQVAEYYGVTEDQILDVIQNRKPVIPKESDTAKALRQRFSDVTGLTPAVKTIEAVANQDPSKLQSKMTKKDQQEADLIRDKEAREFEESQNQTEQDAEPAKVRRSFAEVVVGEDFVKKVKTFIKNNSYKRGRTDLRIREEEKAAGRYNKDLSQLARLAKSVNDQLKKGTPEDLDQFTKIIKGEIEVEDSTLNDELLSTAVAMRSHIDGLSKRLIDTGFLQEEGESKVIDNLGKYLTTTYRLYETDDWASKVPEAVVKKAKGFIKSQASTRKAALKNTGLDKLSKAVGGNFEAYATEQELNRYEQEVNKIVDEEIDRILNKSPNHKYNKQYRNPDGSINKGILMKKSEDIPLPIQHLMGLVENPLENYASSVMKLSGLVNGLEFQNALKNSKEKLFTTERTETNTVQVEGDLANKLPMLKDLYMSPETKKTFEVEAKAYIEWYEYAVKLGGYVKAGKTVLSPATHIKNLLGNAGFMLMNGHLSPGKINEGYKVIRNEMLNGDKKALQDRYKLYQELGLVGQSATLGDVKSMFGEATFEMAYQKSPDQVSSFDQAQGLIKEKGITGKAFDKAAKAYQMEDDLFKVIAFEMEKDRLAQAYYKNDYNSLTEDQKNFVNDEAVMYVKDTYPTFDRVPPIVKSIGRFPIFGNFVSFTSESIRTSAKVFKLSNDLINSDVNSVANKMYGKGFNSLSDNEKSTVESATEALKNRGKQKKAGAAAYFMLQAGVTSGLALAVKGLVTGDDENEEAEDLRVLGPSWLRHSNIHHTKDGDKGYVVYDLDGLNPHSYFAELIKAGIETEGEMNAFSAVLLKSIEPFVGEDILFGAAKEISLNENSYGGKIWKDTDQFYVKTAKLVDHLIKAVEPGLFSMVTRPIRKTIKGEDPIDSFTDEVKALTGMRPYRVSPLKSFSYDLYDKKNKLRSISRELNADNFDRLNDDALEIKKEIHELVKIVYRLGEEKKDVDKLLIKQLGRRAAFEVTNGRYVPLQIKKKKQ